MSLSLDPSKPPNTGESPTLGASRMRNISAFLLQLLGFTGTSTVTLATAPVVATDLTTGQLTLAAKLVLGADGASGKDAVAFDQFVVSNNAIGYCKFPGGLIIQYVLAGGVTDASTVALPTSFTTLNHWVATAIPQNLGSAPVYSSLYVTPSNFNTVLVNVAVATSLTLAIIAVGF